MLCSFCIDLHQQWHFRYFSAVQEWQVRIHSDLSCKRHGSIPCTKPRGLWMVGPWGTKWLCLRVSHNLFGWRINYYDLETYLFGHRFMEWSYGQTYPFLHYSHSFHSFVPEPFLVPPIRTHAVATAGTASGAAAQKCGSRRSMELGTLTATRYRHLYIAHFVVEIIWHPEVDLFRRCPRI